MNKQFVPLDVGTFGSDKVSKTIVSILNEKKDVVLIRRVSTILTSVNKHLKNIKIIKEDRGTRDVLFQALRAHTLKKINMSKTLAGQEVITYVTNYVVTRLRIALLQK